MCPCRPLPAQVRLAPGVCLALPGVLWKPVEATEIKDKKIIREIIAQIRKPIPQEVYDRLEERDRQLDSLIKTTKPGWEK